MGGNTGNPATILLLICLLLVEAVRGCIYCCECGDLTPFNPYVFLNDSLQLTCQLDEEALNQGVDSSKLFFTYGKEHLRIEEGDVSRPDNLTAVLTKLITSIQDAGSYNCEIDGRSGKDRYVGSQVVEVEYPVHKVEDFRCQLYDWDKNMTCWWNLGDYVNPKNLEVTLYAYESFDNNTYLRYNGNLHIYQNLNTTKYEWPDPALGGDSPVITDVTMWVFIVIVKNNRVNETKSQSQTRFVLPQKDIVKPARVIDFSAETVNSTTVDLTWTMGMRHRGHIFKIRYWSARWNTSDEVLTENKALSTRIDDLVPDTVYTFSIQIRPYYSNQQTGYWSDSVKITYRTNPDVPDMPPTLYMGSFERNAELCTEENGFHTNVSIFWKAIPEINMNGMISYHKVDIKELNGPVAMTTNVSGIGVFSATIQLNCKKSYNVSIQAGNIAGLSNRLSSIAIPSVTELESPSKVLVEVEEVSGNAVVSIKWLYNPDDSIQHFTVYWCYGKCWNNQINWRQVPANRTWLTLSEEEELGDISTLRFGVSADTAEFSSGFKWHACVYKKNGVPRPPQNAKITVAPNGIKVYWSRPQCDGFSAYPASYKITWCPAPGRNSKCEGLIKGYITPDDDTFMYTISNVQMERVYGIRVYSISSSGISSQDKEMIYGVLSNNDLTEAQIAGIVCGSIVAAIVVIAGVIFILRNIYRYLKHLSAPVEISIPDSHYMDLKNGRDSSPDSAYTGLSSPYEVDPLLSDAEKKLTDTQRPKFSHQTSNDSGRGSLEPETTPIHPIIQPAILESPYEKPDLSDLHVDIPIDYAKASMTSPPNSGGQNIPPQELIVNHVTCSQTSASTSKLNSGSHMTNSSSDLSTGVTSYQSVVQKSSSECSTDTSGYDRQEEDMDDSDKSEPITGKSSTESMALLSDTNQEFTNEKENMEDNLVPPNDDNQHNYIDNKDSGASGDMENDSTYFLMQGKRNMEETDESLTDETSPLKQITDQNEEYGGSKNSADDCSEYLLMKLPENSAAT